MKIFNEYRSLTPVGELNPLLMAFNECRSLTRVDEICWIEMVCKYGFYIISGRETMGFPINANLLVVMDRISRAF